MTIYMTAKEGDAIKDRLLEEKMASRLAEIEKEIAWTERRLQNLVFGVEDRQQTEDMLADLREERQRLLGVLGRMARRQWLIG